MTFEPPPRKDFSLMLDSGAHALFNMHIRDQAIPDYAFLRGEHFRTYLHNYGSFCAQYKDKINVPVNLDVIFNPRETWHVQKHLENHYGIQPLPVYHFGEDIKWLHRYMDEYEYIGIGGLGQYISRSAYTKFADRVFKILEDGGNKWKTHGFAMTSIDLAYRYPWYSVDSTTWLKLAIYGRCLIPRFNPNGEAILTKSPRVVSFSLHRMNKADSYFRMSPLEQDRMQRQAHRWGHHIDEETPPSLTASTAARSTFNMIYLIHVSNQDGAPRFYMAGNGRKSEESDTFHRMEHDCGVLVSFWDVCRSGNPVLRLRRLLDDSYEIKSDIELALSDGQTNKILKAKRKRKRGFSTLGDTE